MLYVVPGTWYLVSMNQQHVSQVSTLQSHFLQHRAIGWRNQARLPAVQHSAIGSKTSTLHRLPYLRISNVLSLLTIKLNRLGNRLVTIGQHHLCLLL